MNEQVKKFIEQAGAEELGTGSDLYGGPFIGAIRMDFLEKFAELIIRECIEQIDINNYSSGDEWDAAMTCASNVIKEHFGLAK